MIEAILTSTVVSGLIARVESWYIMIDKNKVKTNLNNLFDEKEQEAILRGIEWYSLPVFIFSAFGLIFLLMFNPLIVFLIFVVVHVLWKYVAINFIKHKIIKPIVFIRPIGIYLLNPIIVFGFISQGIYWGMFFLFFPFFIQLTGVILTGVFNFILPHQPTALNFIICKMYHEITKIDPLDSDFPNKIITFYSQNVIITE